MINSEHGNKNEDEIARDLSARTGFAYVDLAEMTVEPKAIELVPLETCDKFDALPLYIVHDKLTVAMANPLDTEAVAELQSVSGLKVRPAFSALSAIKSAINKYYPSLGKEIAEDSMVSLRQSASLAPVVEMVENIIAKAVELDSSDIHLEPEKSHLNCRYRIDGILHSMPRIPLEYQAAVISRVKIMANMDIAEKRLPQDGRLRMPVARREVDLRISTFPTIYGENLVIRILDHSRGVLKLSQLGFSKHILARFSDLIRRPHGIILVTGPTGSGKTTTLYAALSEINTTEKNIITLEDPVEYEIPMVRQSQVNLKAGLTFSSGLRSIVRQDPDVIMIGEIRDKETADIAIHAALTGHLVFSTLHTNDAPSAVTRLIDMGVEPFLVASSVIGILAQRLVRTLCASCKKEYTPSKELLARLGLAKSVFYKETGCKKCKGLGYARRSGIFEFLIPDDRIKGMIGEKLSATVLREAAVKNGMKTLRDSGLEKVASGITSISELLRVTEEG